MVSQGSCYTQEVHISSEITLVKAKRSCKESVIVTGLTVNLFIFGSRKVGWLAGRSWNSLVGLLGSFPICMETIQVPDVYLKFIENPIYSIRALVG